MLIEMSGEPQMKSGLLGTIMFEDDINQIHVNWDNGSTLALDRHRDKYKILTDKEVRKIKLDKLNK